MVTGLYDAGQFGSEHSHDVLDADFCDIEIAWIDRRALEREGWLIEETDQVRGEPFERALHPKAKEMDYPCTRARGGEAVQIVYVPVGESTKTWANTSWKRWFPRLYQWFLDDSDFRAAKCHGVVFIKSDF